MNGRTELARIREALNHVPAHDRDTWVRMGMAVKSELGEDGFDIWDEWSRRDDTYREADARSVWRSINPNGEVTVGTLFHEAKRHGFKANGHPRRELETAMRDVRSWGVSDSRRATLSGIWRLGKADVQLRQRPGCGALLVARSATPRASLTSGLLGGRLRQP
jgi:hypothetical protein